MPVREEGHEGMTERRDLFLRLVQTGVIVMDIQTRGGLAVDVLAIAARIPEEQLPADLEHGANTLIDYNYGMGERPAWLPPPGTLEEGP